MKLNDPRLTLIAGLAVALNLSGSKLAPASEMTAKKTTTFVQVQYGANSAPPSAPSPGVPVPSTTPLIPTPDPYSSSVNLNPQPIPPNPSTVTTVPMQLGTPPSLTPAPRPPMGLFYGEQERLDAMYNPAPRPLPASSYPMPVPPYQTPSTTLGIPSQPLIVDGGIPQYSSTDRFGFAPPPGTLGQTYKRRSRPIEDTKHPRIGVVEVNLPEEVDVTAKGLKIKWTGKVWRLESDSLIPGIPHIYEVKASWGEGTQPQVRTVRLIMGRIVDLDF